MGKYAVNATVYDDDGGAVTVKRLSGVDTTEVCTGDDYVDLDAEGVAELIAALRSSQEGTS